MKVRVYDADTNTYFKSEVYALINIGWFEKQLVLVPDANNPYMKLFDSFDKTDKIAKPIINTIISGASDWINFETDSPDKQIPEFVDYLNDDIKFFFFAGYPWISEEKSTLIRLLNGDSIPVKGSIFENRIYNSNMPDWNYVDTQEDADLLLHNASGFHDSIIKEMSYIEGGYVNENKAMSFMPGGKTLTVIVDSQWNPSIEMIFESGIAMNLRSSGGEYTKSIYGASVFVKDACAIFCDEYVKSIDDIEKLPDSTWIKAYSLRWRFIE